MSTAQIIAAQVAVKALKLAVAPKGMAIIMFLVSALIVACVQNTASTLLAVFLWLLLVGPSIDELKSTLGKACHNRRVGLSLFLAACATIIDDTIKGTLLFVAFAVAALGINLGDLFFPFLHGSSDWFDHRAAAFPVLCQNATQSTMQPSASTTGSTFSTSFAEISSEGTLIGSTSESQSTKSGRFLELFLALGALVEAAEHELLLSSNTKLLDGSIKSTQTLKKGKDEEGARTRDDEDDEDDGGSPDTDEDDEDDDDNKEKTSQQQPLMVIVWEKGPFGLNFDRTFEKSVLKVIGQGGNGKVVLYHDDLAGENRAAKLILDQPSRDQTLDNFMSQMLSDRTSLKKEYEVTEKLAHPNIVRVHEFRRHADGLGCRMTMEVMDKDLHFLLGSLAGKPACQETMLLEAMRQVMAACEHMHMMGYVHADLKAANVLVKLHAGSDGQNRWICKLADLGMANDDLDARDAEVTTEGICPWEVATRHIRHPSWDVYSAFILIAEVTGICNLHGIKKRNNIKWSQRVAQVLEPDIYANVKDDRIKDFSDWVARNPEDRITSTVARERLDIFSTLPMPRDANGLETTKFPRGERERAGRNQEWAEVIHKMAASDPGSFFSGVSDVWCFARLWRDHAVIMEQLFPEGSERKHALEQLAK